MTTRDDLDRALSSWFEAAADSSGAATLLESTLAQTSGRQARPAWAVALRGTAFGRVGGADRPALVRLRYAAIVVVLMALLATIGLIVAGQRQSPRPGPTPLCVGTPATLCSHSAGDLTTQAFLTGLTMRLPTDGWWARDLPDRLELKPAPFSTQAMLLLDPIPVPEPWEPDPDLSGTIPSLVDWLQRNPKVVLGQVTRRQTATGLAATTFDMTASGGRRCVKTLNTRPNPGGTHFIEACNDGQRVHLVDVGGGHVVLILLEAFDHRQDTLERFDASFAPILDSIRPPASIAP